MESKTYSEQEVSEQAKHLHKQGHISEAEKLYRFVLSKNPYNTNALLGLAILATQFKKYEPAEQLIAKALTISPNDKEIQFHAGELKFAQNLFNEAIGYFKNTIGLSPEYELAYFRLGEAYKELNQYGLAEEYFKKSLLLNPDCFPTENNLATALMNQGKYDEALQYLNKILHKYPDNVDALCNKGLLLVKTGNDKEAEDLFNKALSINPKHETSLFNIAMLYQNRKIIDKAIINYKLLLEISPHHQQGLVSFLHSKRIACDWEDIGKFEAKVDNITASQINAGKVPFETAFENITRSCNLALNLQVASLHCKKLPAQRFSFEGRQNKKILNIGYISGDFRNHALAHLTQKLFALHERKRFKIFTYSYGIDDKSVYRLNIKNNSDKFTDISNVSYSDAADIIYKDNIDILIDLTGFTGKSRMQILAQKPAPIQISYLGFIGSSGSDFIDYIIADETVISKNEQHYYSEKVIYLPNCYQINSYGANESEPLTRKEVGLAEGSFVFCSFNQSLKIDPELFSSWMNILKQSPNSVLWLYHDNDQAVINLRSQAIKQGISQSRLVFSKAIKRDRYLQRLKLADMSLDTQIYNGGTITSDCLWCEVPVITIFGKHFASRMASSILKNIGLEELITNSLQDYENLAVYYANNKKAFAALKDKLRKNKNTKPLFDTRQTVKDLEKLMRKL